MFDRDDLPNWQVIPQNKSIYSKISSLGSAWQTSGFNQACWWSRNSRIWRNPRWLARTRSCLSRWPIRSLWNVWSYRFVFRIVTRKSSCCNLFRRSSIAWVFNDRCHSLWVTKKNTINRFKICLVNYGIYPRATKIKHIIS